ncbi:MAG: hypothetical protein U0835_10065 [Isosphaeraceae bacterium]
MLRAGLRSEGRCHGLRLPGEGPERYGVVEFDRQHRPCRTTEEKPKAPEVALP